MTDQLPIEFNAPQPSGFPPLKLRGGEGELCSVAERRILDLLPSGRENAISMPRLAELVCVSTRELQSLIQHLINDHGIMIASATGKNHGYFYPETAEEYRAAVDQLKHRIISLARRIRAIDRTAYEEIFGQGKLNVEG